MRFNPTAEEQNDVGVDIGCGSHKWHGGGATKGSAFLTATRARAHVLKVDVRADGIVAGAASGLAAR